MKKILLALLLIVTSLHSTKADEGMWLPMLLKEYNIKDMQKKGFRLSAKDVYNINKASLKDAIIGLGKEGSPFMHFCTGELISKEGLILTNHHCAFGLIQAHSNLENNYIKDGFWAKNKEEELANPGITASILVRMEDVTEKVLGQVNDEMKADERAKKIKEAITELEKNAVKDTKYMANVKAFFNDNQYFLFVYNIYKDVRLVGAPSKSIGSFGGDTDNWMWPRHSADFALLRIYSDKNNEPAAYSKENQAYKPDYSLTISTKGVKEKDFTMVFGYPGTTKQYIPSFAVEELANIEYPHKIKIRDAKLKVINAAMESDELLRIKYSAKAANLANAWKKWQGEIKGFARFNTIDKKREEEKDFSLWAKDKPKYKNLVNDFEHLYKERQDIILTLSYLSEAAKGGAEIFSFASNIYNKLKDTSAINKKEDLDLLKKQLLKYTEGFYKDYDLATDKLIFSSMLNLYVELENKVKPDIIRDLTQDKIADFVETIYSNTLFNSKDDVIAFINNINLESEEVLTKDKAVEFYLSYDRLFVTSLAPKLPQINAKSSALNHIWMKALMEKDKDRVFYPDANSTLRVAYGSVGGYSPKDGIYYKHFTTLEGIIEKDNPNIYDYNIPEKLRQLYKTKDYGSYAEDGELPVCFIANNHTTGGNSGSPIINAKGHLIGINFDRAWDGVMSDIEYDEDICRNIATDIRYILFLIEKVGEASHLIDEMEIN